MKEAEFSFDFIYLYNINSVYIFSKQKWIVGAPCRAAYSEDGVIYEAIILKIYENKTCIVKFVGNIFSMIAVYNINQEI